MLSASNEANIRCWFWIKTCTIISISFTLLSPSLSIPLLAEFSGKIVGAIVSSSQLLQYVQTTVHGKNKEKTHNENYIALIISCVTTNLSASGKKKSRGRKQNPENENFMRELWTMKTLERDEWVDADDEIPKKDQPKIFKTLCLFS